MDWDFETHFDTCVLIPTVVLQIAKCENPDCQELHGLIALSFLCWTLEVYL